MNAENNDTNQTLNIPLITQDDLYHNELWWLVTILAYYITKKKNKDEISNYVLDIYGIISKIGNCISIINQSKGFIRRRPSIKQLDDNDQMTITGYYMYHYDVVIHKLSTIRDLSYKLINITCKLGLNDKYCNWENLKKKKNQIPVVGIMNLQQLYYKLLEQIEEERNRSTHSGEINLTFLNELDIFVSASQAIRIYNIPLLKEWEPMAKGSYNEYLLHKKKKQLIERIEYYQNITIFFIHALTCCLNNVFQNNLSDDFKIEFKANFEHANEVMDKYDKKNNKLVYILDWLIHLDNAVKKYHEQELKVGKESIIYFE